MERTNTWEDMLNDALHANGETWDDIESNTMTDKEMKETFYSGYGLEVGCPFTVWTKKHIYFPVCYNGAEWVGWVPRHPDGEPTYHIGGG